MIMLDSLYELFYKGIVEIAQIMPAISTSLVRTSLQVETMLNTVDILSSPLSAELIASVYSIIYVAVLALVVLKCVWKGFQVYVLWRDGDADVSPHSLLVGVAMTLIVSIAFPFAYNAATAVTVELGAQIIQTINITTGLDPALFDDEDTGQLAEKAWADFFAAYDTDGDKALSEAEELVLDNAMREDAAFQQDFIRRLTQRVTNFYQGSLDTPEAYNTVRDYLYALANDGQLNVAFFDDLYHQSTVERLSWLNTAAGDFMAALLVLVYLICYCVMFCKLVGRGVEMLFLRWGLPLAAMGLVNSDGGIFPSYVQLMLKQMATSLIQVTALFLSGYIVLGGTDTNILLGIVMIGVAFKAPALLSQIMTPQRSGGGVGTKLHTGLLLKQLLTGGK